MFSTYVYMVKALLIIAYFYYPASFHTWLRTVKLFFSTLSVLNVRGSPCFHGWFHVVLWAGALTTPRLFDTSEMSHRKGQLLNGMSRFVCTLIPSFCPAVSIKSITSFMMLAASCTYPLLIRQSDLRMAVHLLSRWHLWFSLSHEAAINF